MSRPEEDGMIEDLLRRRAGKAPARGGLGGPSCGVAELLAAFAEGALSDPERGDFERHLAACGACREAVARLVRLAPRDASAPAPEPVRAWWTRWAWAVPVLAGVTLVGSFAWYEHERIVQPQSELVRVSPPAVAPAEPAAGSDVESASRRQKAEGSRQPEAKDQPPPPPAMQERSRARKKESGEFAPAPSEDQKKGKTILPDAESRAAAPEPKAMAQAKEEDAVSPAGAGAMSRPLAAREKTAARDESSSDAAKLPAAPQKMSLAPAADAAGRADKQVQAATPSVAPPSLNETVVAGTLAKRAAAALPAEGRIAQRRQVGKRQSWVLMADGRLFFSCDGGQSWRQMTTPEAPQSIAFQDENSGEIVARSGRKYKTTDGGKTWEKQ